MMVTRGGNGNGEDLAALASRYKPIDHKQRQKDMNLQIM